jgi:hypothetical protein
MRTDTTGSCSCDGVGSMSPCHPTVQRVLDGCEAETYVALPAGFATRATQLRHIPWLPNSGTSRARYALVAGETPGRRES